jgi:mono/diheme cytochrome c family protein
MSKRLLKLAALSLVAIRGSAYTFGGWAVVTVEDLPEHLRAGQPTKISFVVRQHGVQILQGLNATVVATDGTSEVKVPATTSDGRYSANLTVPRAGNWSVTIHSGFMNNRLALRPMLAVAPSAPAPAAMAVGQRGEHLFVAKGCGTCHAMDVIPGSGAIAVGPNLSPKRYQPEFLTRFLVDPSIQRTPGAQNQMPKLELNPQEIAALVAFINSDRKVAAK